MRKKLAWKQRRAMVYRRTAMINTTPETTTTTTMGPRVIDRQK
jgi:hypothetical protein